MFRTVVSVVTCLIPLTSLASLDLVRPRNLHRIAVDPRVGGGETYFERVVEAHRAAESVPIQKISGKETSLYIGRCYYTDSPMQPVAAIVAVLAPDTKTYGPLGQDTRLVPLIDRHSRPEKYDELTPKQARSIASLAQDFTSELAIPVETRRETFVVGFRTPDEDSRLYRFRRDKQNLYMRLDCAEDQVCLSPNSNLGRHTVYAYEGEIIAQCHYFKRVRLKP